MGSFETSHQMQIIQSTWRPHLGDCRLTIVDNLLWDELASRFVVRPRLALAEGPGLMIISVYLTCRNEESYASPKTSTEVGMSVFPSGKCRHAIIADVYVCKTAIFHCRVLSHACCLPTPATLIYARTP